ncbi:MAG: lysophospholipid acyltransferase family protein [Phycisphaerae bacterium]
MNLESLRFLYLRHIVVPLFGALGFERASALAARLARRIHALGLPGRRRAEERALRVLRGRRESVEGMVAEMFRQQGRFWAEALFARRFMGGGRCERFVHIDGEPALRDLAAFGRGCIVTTAYFGNPAVCVMALGSLFRPIHVIVDLFAQPVLRAWQRELYSNRWMRPIERRDAARAVPGILERGGTVMIIAEHERLRGPSVAVDFLGRRLRCYPTLGRLARWFDVPIAVVACRRTPRPFSFALSLQDVVRHPASCQRTPGRSADDAEVVRRVMALLERAVLRDPAQYLWSIETAADRMASLAAPVIEMETESDSCRTVCQTGSASRWRSAAGTARAAAHSTAATALAPTA